LKSSALAPRGPAHLQGRIAGRTNRINYTMARRLGPAFLAVTAAVGAAAHPGGHGGAFPPSAAAAAKAAAAAAPPPPPRRAAPAGAAVPTWADGDPGVANLGRNLTTFTMSTNTTAECFAACVSNASCAAWQVTVSSPSCTGGGPAVCALKSEYGGSWATMEGPLAPCALDPCAVSGPAVRPGGPPALAPVAFSPPALSGVVPGGWLAAELALSAAALPGHLADMWVDVANSSWVGGTGDGYLHERGPYWLNGAAPLSALLGNAGAPGAASLSATTRAYLRYIADHAAPSGWLGPDDTKSGDEYWARMNVVAALLQWADGHGDDAAWAVPTALAYVPEAMRRMLGAGNMSYALNDWSAARVQDYLLSLYAAIDRFDDLAAAGLVPPGVTPAGLYDAAAVAHGQAIANGAVWEAWFASPAFPNTTVTSNFGMLTHGVNVAQAIKSGGVWWRQARNASLIASTYQRIAVLDEFHGSPAGVVQADEHLAGAPPQHGTELCGIVEAAYSYETLGDVLGDPFFFDRVERVVFNALPAAALKNYSAHNYLSQANEMQAVVSNPHAWVTDGPWGNVLGLEPNYGCCLAASCWRRETGGTPATTRRGRGGCGGVRACGTRRRFSSLTTPLCPAPDPDCPYPPPSLPSPRSAGPSRTGSRASPSTRRGCTRCPPPPAASR
jgi:hypothetical protein